MTAPASLLAVELELPYISDHCRKLFLDGYFREAVRHEAELVLTNVKSSAERPDLDGQPLISAALSEKAPILSVNERQTKQEQNEHAGFLHLALAVVRGARNIYTHDVVTEVPREQAVFWLAVLNQLNALLIRAYRVG